MLTGLIGDGLTCASAGHAPEGDIERLHDVVISISLFFSIFLYFAIFVYSVPGWLAAPLCEVLRSLPPGEFAGFRERGSGTGGAGGTSGTAYNLSPRKNFAQ